MITITINNTENEPIIVENNNSIIGKEYYLHDNSYAVNLTTPIERNNYIKEYNLVNNPYLAGTSSTSRIKAIILTEPFIAKVETGVRNITSQEVCIIVKRLDTGDTCFVLFNTKGIIKY